MTGEKRRHLAAFLPGFFGTECCWIRTTISPNEYRGKEILQNLYSTPFLKNAANSPGVFSIEYWQM
jgi:hypothetical protein